MNKTTSDKTATEAADLLDGVVMRFMDCPLGTRFKYKEHKIPVYVVLSHYGEDGCGLVAKWEGVDGDARMQQVFSAESSEDECRHLEVIVVA